MDQDTKLHEAVRLGDADLVREALVEGLDPDVLGMYQWGPLHEAASNGDLDILRLLLYFEANPNKVDQLHGNTPLHYAAQDDHGDCLRELLGAGGSYDLPNNDGETSLDVACGSCKVILEKERTEKLMELSLEDARKVIHRSPSEGSFQDLNLNRRNNLGSLERDVFEGNDNRFFGRSSPTAWDKVEVIESNRNSIEPGTGLLQLSFEYNSKNGNLKIRVWQLEDVLLPLAEFPSINRIYIKSLLLPDKKNDSKRRTEEIKIDDPMKMNSHIVTLRRKYEIDGFKSIFLPTTFKFQKALVYQDVKKDAIANKTIHLDVCARMRYSTKSLPVASVQFPLKIAVRKLRKEKFALLPTINYSMPDNIHVSNPKDFVVVMEGMYANRTTSNPTLRNTVTDYVDEKPKATSDIDIKTVRCQSFESLSSGFGRPPSVVVSMPSELTSDLKGKRKNSFEELTEVKVHEHNVYGRDLGSSVSVFAQIHKVDPSLPGSTEDDLSSVEIDSPSSRLSRSAPEITKLQIEDMEEETTLISIKTHQTSRVKEEKIDVPKILVTGTDGRTTPETASVAIEMRDLIKAKMAEKQQERKRHQRKANQSKAKPGHVIDMRTVEEKQGHDLRPQGEGPVSTVTEVHEVDMEYKKQEMKRRIKKKLESSKVKEDRGQRPVHNIVASREPVKEPPLVSYKEISEEKPRSPLRRSPRSSPRSSPKMSSRVRKESSACYDKQSEDLSRKIDFEMGDEKSNKDIVRQSGRGDGHLVVQVEDETSPKPRLAVRSKAGSHTPDVYSKSETDIPSAVGTKLQDTSDNENRRFHSRSKQFVNSMTYTHQTTNSSKLDSSAIQSNLRDNYCLTNNSIPKHSTKNLYGQKSKSPTVPVEVTPPIRVGLAKTDIVHSRHERLDKHKEHVGDVGEYEMLEANNDNSHVVQDIGRRRRKQRAFTSEVTEL